MGEALEVRARKSPNVTLAPDVLETEARRWADDNAELVATYTAMVERDGLPLAKYRTF